jgi:acyl transferase domain-containing protein/NADP-dependent 3-hydroxy acid dehydrogenase YdfG/acyl carrier protein
VIKMTLALREGLLPRTLHVDEPTPHVDWEAGAVELLTEPRPWERGDRPRRAGVSSFGISGTNAHLIVEEAPPRRPVSPAGEPAIESPLVALPIAAKSAEALPAQAAGLRAHLERNPELDPRDVGLSLAAGRAALEHRAVAVGADREELIEALAALAAGQPHPSLTQGRASAGKLAFLFSGQGAQRAGMGRELYASFPAFARALDEVCAELDPQLERPLRDLLFAPEGSEEAALLDRTEYTQPALFALEVALFRGLRSLGFAPDYLLGHSIGELAAAHVAGVFDLADACRLIAARGALMGALPEGGGMVAIEAGEDEVAAELPAGLAIAAINGPSSVVVSGEREAALAFAEPWKQRGRKTTGLRVSHAFHSALVEPMLDEFEAVARTVSYAPPGLTVLSNLTGEPLTAEQATDPAYWVAQVRSTVRFADGVGYLAEQGTTTCLELGPGTNLCAAAGTAFDDKGSAAVAIPTLRKGSEEPRSLLTAIAAAHAHGASPDWGALFAGASRVALPTYAFQRQRFWLEPGAASADAAANGQLASEHPLLPAAISLPDGGQLLTGRLSLKSHPWLADHAVHGAAVLPGAAFAEMALKAAEVAGAEGIEELTIEAPLALPEDGAVQVQVSVGAERDGSRPLSIHARPEDPEHPDGEWVAHARGSLGAVAVPLAEGSAQWPPPGAEEVSPGSFHQQLAELGADYGPSFQGLRSAWRRGEELHAEVELGPERAAEAGHYGLHPALLEAALAPALASADGGELRQALAWTGMALRAPGASQLRVTLAAPDGEGARALLLASAAGEPLASATVAPRPLAAAEVAAASDSGAEALFELAWVERELPVGEGPTGRPLTLAPDPALDPAAAAIALCEQALTALREATAAGERLALVTAGAVATAADPPPDPAAAAVWGLLRSVQAEQPGRFLAIDSDGSEPSRAALEAALAQDAEPQLALRAGRALVPRLARAATAAAEPVALDPERTVLLTGAGGSLAAPLARHLVGAGARHLLLVGRRGAEAPAAAALATELEGLGATVTLAACDVGDREALAALLAAIPAERPLGAAFHLADDGEDGLLEALDAERLDAALRAKAAGAWNLHELTREAGLSELVLYSSLAGTLGVPGQGGHGAADAFLDALARDRAAAGLAARAVAWGPWEGAELDEATRSRLARAGLRPLAAESGLALLDRLRAQAPGAAVAVDLDRAALREQARAGVLPPLLAGLVRVPAGRAAGGGAFLRRLAATPEDERQALALELVAAQVAALLGHAAATAIDSELPFKDLGFDSLAAVELRNRLSVAVGAPLPATLVFDHPTTSAVAAFLCGLAAPETAAAIEVDAAIDALRELLDRVGEEQREQANARIRSLLHEGYAAGGDADAVDRIRGASAEEILAIVNDEIGAE